MTPLTTLLFLAHTVVSAPIVYNLVPGDSLAYVQVFKNRTTTLQSIAHDHVLRAAVLKGSVSVDPNAPEACNVTFETPVAELRIDEDDLRKKVGYENLVGESDRGRITEHMRDEDQMHVDAYPFIRFTAHACQRTGEGTYKVKGVLNVHGKDKPLDVDVKAHIDAQKLSAEGAFSVTHEDFGMKPYSGLMGTVKNTTDLKFTFALHGVATP